MPVANERRPNQGLGKINPSKTVVLINCKHCFPLETPLTYAAIDDLIDVKSELLPVVARWKDIGLALRLDPSQLDEIESNNRNASDCLTKVLTLWLKKAYNTERFGEPSWELLARAVVNPAGGNNPALAEEIAKKWYI